MMQPDQSGWCSLREFGRMSLGNRNRFWHARGLLAITFLMTLPLIADEKPTSATPEEGTADKAGHLERMRTLAASIKVFEFAGEERFTAKLVERPVLSYRDDTRKQHDSTIWIFGVPAASKGPATNTGRPTAMMAIEYYPSRPKTTEWLYEIVSLSTGQIAVDRDPELHWRAKQAGLEFKPMADAPAPAEKATVRLAQMRELRRRFTAYELEGTDGRVELRPLSAPLYRYQDAEKGIIDGAVFAFANGTNPELLWVVEARGGEGATPTWQFGLAQMTGAGVHVSLDGEQVWTCTEANPPAIRDSYVNGWMAAPPASE